MGNRHCQHRLIPARAGNISGSWSSDPCRSAHPRSRGEHPDSRECCFTPCGSSPLARGTCGVDDLRRGSSRLIPARAGNILHARPRRYPFSAHPRSRGEHWPLTLWGRCLRGSSPLARGTFHQQTDAPRALRLIPARAGNMTVRSVRCASMKAHPRSRGEHVHVTSTSKLLSGSSPLARGTYHGCDLDGLNRRLIPARAGNMSLVARSRMPATAHPRSRGEHVAVTTLTLGAAGSSPLARGTYIEVTPPHPAVRLIPARAGNMRRALHHGRLPSAHPRSRGEHRSVSVACACMSGSSPLARGTSTDKNGLRRYSRLIPARAGNIPQTSAWSLRNPAHPRSRGEHVLPPFTPFILYGSSPLARGTPRSPISWLTSGRLIPARAGNTSAMPDKLLRAAAHPRSRGEHGFLK